MKVGAGVVRFPATAELSRRLGRLVIREVFAGARGALRLVRRGERRLDSYRGLPLSAWPGARPRAGLHGRSCHRATGARAASARIAPPRLPRHGLGRRSTPTHGRCARHRAPRPPGRRRRCPRRPGTGPLVAPIDPGASTAGARRSPASLPRLAARRGRLLLLIAPPRLGARDARGQHPGRRRGAHRATRLGRPGVQRGDHPAAGLGPRLRSRRHAGRRRGRHPHPRRSRRPPASAYDPICRTAPISSPTASSRPTPTRSRGPTRSSIGHPVAGSRPPHRPPTARGRSTWRSGFSRWLTYAGSALGLGGFAFLVWCWPAGWSVRRARLLVGDAGSACSPSAPCSALLLKGPYDAGVGLGSATDGAPAPRGPRHDVRPGPRRPAAPDRRCSSCCSPIASSSRRDGWSPLRRACWPGPA